MHLLHPWFQSRWKISAAVGSTWDWTLETILLAPVKLNDTEGVRSSTSIVVVLDRLRVVMLSTLTAAEANCFWTRSTYPCAAESLLWPVWALSCMRVRPSSAQKVALFAILKVLLVGSWIRKNNQFCNHLANVESQELCVHMLSHFLLFLLSIAANQRCFVHTRRESKACF